MEEEYRFRGVCAGLNMANRYKVYDNYTSWYPCMVRLQAARLNAGYTMTELAAILGVHRTTVMRWERGEIRTMEKTVADRWANACGCSVDFLVQGKASGNYRLQMKATSMASLFKMYPAENVPVEKSPRHGRRERGPKPWEGVI